MYLYYSAEYQNSILLIFFKILITAQIEHSSPVFLKISGILAVLQTPTRQYGGV